MDRSQAETKARHDSAHDGSSLLFPVEFFRCVGGSRSRSLASSKEGDGVSGPL